MPVEMTPEQIKNWRSVLAGMIGPYAFMMPDAEVVAMRDKMQERVNEIGKKGESNGCK